MKQKIETATLLWTDGKKEIYAIENGRFTYSVKVHELEMKFVEKNKMLHYLTDRYQIDEVFYGKIFELCQKWELSVSNAEIKKRNNEGLADAKKVFRR